MNNNETNSPLEAPRRAPGIGLLIGQKCSRCHKHAPTIGGGTLGLRWYGKCCKPAVKAARDDAKLRGML